MLQQQCKASGFIPLSNLVPVEKVKRGNPVINKDLCKCPVKLYELVRKSGKPNYLGAQIQVNFDFN